MTHNELRKGQKVVLTGERYGTIMDNRKGILRCVKIEERDGYYPDMGDVYVWEIVVALSAFPWEADSFVADVIDLSPAHKQRQKKVGHWMNIAKTDYFAKPWG